MKQEAGCDPGFFEQVKFSEAAGITIIAFE
jgi:hypothetical protein